MVEHLDGRTVSELAVDSNELQLAQALQQSGVNPNTKQADEIITRLKRYREHPWAAIEDGIIWTLDSAKLSDPKGVIKIGRASCRERV